MRYLNHGKTTVRLGMILRDLATQAVCLLVCGSLLLSLGCNSQDPEFSESDLAKRLTPPARTGVKTVLTDLFGTALKPHFPDQAELYAEIIETRQVESTGNPGEFRLTVGSSLAEQLDFSAGDELEQVSVTDPPEDAEGTELYIRLAPRMVTVLAVEDTEQISEHDFEKSITVKAAPGIEFAEYDAFRVKPNEQLRAGHNLYWKQCQMCHGISGAGDGPQAHVLNPKPRDFRLGIFKYTSTQPNTKASDADLQRVIKHGIAGTGMPAFKGLGNHEIAQVVEYVKFLAIRGETERQIILETEVDFGNEAYADEVEKAGSAQEIEQARRIFESEQAEYLEQELPWITGGIVFNLGEDWYVANQESVIVAPATTKPEPDAKSAANPDLTSLANGKRLYLSDNAQCVTCHGATGGGDGEQTRMIQKKPDGSDYETPGLHDAWGQMVKPRDLAYGVFHGGREPIDLYRRIFAGVKGTPMPGYGHKGLSEAEIWDLVNYIYYLSGEYPQLSPDQPAR